MEKNDRLVGYALYYYSYSTWNGRALYVEDLFVREEYRSTWNISCFMYTDDVNLYVPQLLGKGLGAALMKECAKVSAYIDCSGVRVQALRYTADSKIKAVCSYDVDSTGLEPESNRFLR